MTKIESHNGRPAVMIDGTVYPPSFVTVRTRDNGGKDIVFDSEYFKNLGKSGIKVYFFHCNTLRIQPNSIELFDREARALLEVVPDAYIMPRVGLHPTNEWVLLHPDECIKYGDGYQPPMHLFSESYEVDMPLTYSLCSQEWRVWAGEALGELWKKLMELPYADRIIGCFPAAGKTSEWMYPCLFIDEENRRTLGHSAAFKREFSEFLRITYGTEENLRRAWGKPDVKIDDPPIPTYEELYFAKLCDFDAARPKYALSNAPVPKAYSYGTHIGSFTDIDKFPHVYDFIRAWHFGPARSQIYFAKIIKDITPDRIVGMCYGSQGCDDQTLSGRNGATRLILESPYNDFMLNPSVYENRQPGGAPAQRVVEDSFALHGKIYISQEDTRTLAENRFFKDKYAVYDMTDSINALKREYGKNICTDLTAWWFDQLLGGGRYKFPEIYELFEKQQRIGREAYSLDRKKRNEVAFIFDEESMQAVSRQTTYELVEMLRNYELPYFGAGYDQYYHDDMKNPDMPPHKLYVFVNTLVLTKEEREVIKDRLVREGACALWLYAPGFIDTSAEKKLACEHISELVGINISMVEDSFDANFRWVDKPHEITRELGSREIFGNLKRKRTFGSLPPFAFSHWDSYLYPLFYPDDDSAEELAYFVSTGYPAVALKELDGYRSIFYGAKHINSKTLRAIAKFAGVHIYSESEDVIFVGRNYITHHASSSGRKHIRLPKKSTVTEVYENRVYAEEACEFFFDSYFGETKMFRILELE